jgi:hypothetical protein
MRFALAVLFAFTAIAPASAPADAARAAKRSAYSTKMCISTDLANKRVSWKCLNDQRCCWNGFTNTGYCSSGGC